MAVKKITLISQEEIKFAGDEGKLIEGFMYLGFLESNKAIRFWSTQEHDVHDVLEFDRVLAKEINLKAKLDFKTGGIKFSEID